MSAPTAALRISYPSMRAPRLPCGVDQVAKRGDEQLGRRRRAVLATGFQGLVHHHAVLAHGYLIGLTGHEPDVQLSMGLDGRRDRHDNAPLG